MANKNNSESGPVELKIEDVLPVKTVGLECMNESNPEKMSPHRYVYKWFARRPTSATRLAILASVLPNSVTNDELLRLMQIGPKNMDQIEGSISDYVSEKFATKDNRGNKSVQEHFEYPIPHSQVPSNEELESFHEELRSVWGGDLPIVLDPTAGGGTIPLEAARYGLPTYSNELNPIPWLINKVILEYAQGVGSIKTEVYKWAKKIDERAKEQLESYFPSAELGQTPTYYLCSYSIKCPSCGKPLPLSRRWWLYRESAGKGHAVRPHIRDDDIEYEHVRLPEDVTTDEFDPDEGAVSNAEAECPSCGVVTQRDKLTTLMQDGGFDYEVCGVVYEKERDSGLHYRAASEADKQALLDAESKISDDLRLSTLLSTDRFIGSQDRAGPYGMKQWRDIFSPRQFLSHAT